MHGCYGKADEYEMGAFAAGVIEGSDGTAQGVDGGELYDLNTKEQFETSYQFQKYGIADPKTKCPFMDDKLRKEWPRKCSVAYGVFDEQAPNKDKWEWSEWRLIKDTSFLKARLVNALRRSDKYVWLYFQGYDMMVKPNGVLADKMKPLPQDWVDAIAESRAAAGRE